MVEAAITMADAVIAQANQVTQKIIELRVSQPLVLLISSRVTNLTWSFSVCPLR